MTLVFATHNSNKAHEVRKMLPPGLELFTLDEIGCTEEIPETADTLEGNAELKAAHVVRTYGRSCFADDTGLLVNALDGAPGVYSARYAGPGKDSAANIEKLLKELRGAEDRSAFFRTVIILLHQGKRFEFRGEVHGQIAKSPTGNGGFGYDPVFIPQGYDKSFAELPLEEKNCISHRAKAFGKLLEFLDSNGLRH